MQPSRNCRLTTGVAVAAAEAAVQEQAAAVRALKDGGKGNADPDVKAAVEELLARKGRLEQMQQRAAAAEADAAEAGAAEARPGS